MDIPKTDIRRITLTDGSHIYNVIITLPFHTDIITCFTTSKAHALRLQQELDKCMDIEVTY